MSGCVDLQACLCVEQGVLCGVIVIRLVKLRGETVASSLSAMMLMSLSLVFKGRLLITSLISAVLIVLFIRFSLKVVLKS